MTESKTTKEAPNFPKWECFRDTAYYDMYCVRLIGDKAFGLRFHLVNEDEAQALAGLLELNMVNNYGN
jgi:hypothetical protein